MQYLVALWVATAAVMLVVVTGDDRKEEPIVLPPVVDAGVEAALLIVPGAYINGQHYQSLGEAIQAASPLRLWVGLVRPFPLDLPNPIAVFPAMEQTLEAMRLQGMDTKNIFISGHSLGGVVLQNENWSQENRVQGWIMLASYLTDLPLPAAPLPVMHVSGELDGLTRITNIYAMFKQLEAMIVTEDVAVYQSAVVVLPQINHMHFASGERPALVASSDILSPVSMEDGQALIAEQVSAYLTAVLKLPVEHLEGAHATLLKAHLTTADLMQPIDLMNELTWGEGIRSGWTEEGQVIMSTIKDHTRITVQDTIHTDTSSFGESKPQVKLAGDVAEVTTHTHVYNKTLIVGPTDISPKEMGTKFKSREAVMEVLAPLGVEFGEEVSCREVNQAALDFALTAVSISARERYNSRGRRMSFLTDDVKATGAGWLSAHLTYTETDDGLEVTSPSLPTGVNVGFGLGGMHYCKLLTPSRALEYVIVDSLVGTQP